MVPAARNQSDASVRVTRAVFYVAKSPIDCSGEFGCSGGAVVYEGQSPPVSTWVPGSSYSDCSGEWGCTTYDTPGHWTEIGDVQKDLRYLAPWGWIGLDGMYGWTGDGQFQGNAFANRANVEKILTPFGTRAIDLGDEGAYILWKKNADINGRFTPAEANAASIIQNAVSYALTQPEFVNSAKAKAILAYFATPAWQSVIQQSTEAAYKLGVAHASANESMSAFQSFAQAFAGFMKVAGPLMAATAMLAVAAEAATATAAPEAISAGDTGVFDFDFGADIGDFSLDVGDLDFGEFTDFGAEIPDFATDFGPDLPGDWSLDVAEVPLDDVPFDIPGETFEVPDVSGDVLDFSEADYFTDSWVPEFDTSNLSFNDFLKYGNKALDAWKQYTAIQQKNAAASAPRSPIQTGSRPITQSPVPQYPVSLAPTRVVQPPPGYAFDSILQRLIPAGDPAMMQDFTDETFTPLQDEGISSNLLLWGGVGLLALLALSAKRR